MSSSSSPSSLPSNVHVKVVFDGRTFLISLPLPPTYASLHSTIRSTLGSQHSSIQSPSNHLQFHYLDADQDQIAIHDDHVMDHAVEFAQKSGKQLKLYLTVVSSVSSSATVPVGVEQKTPSIGLPPSSSSASTVTSCPVTSRGGGIAAAQIIGNVRPTHPHNLY